MSNETVTAETGTAPLEGRLQIAHRLGILCGDDFPNQDLPEDPYLEIRVEVKDHDPERLRATAARMHYRVQAARDKLAALQRELVAGPEGQAVKAVRERLSALWERGESAPEELAEVQADYQRAADAYTAVFQARVRELRDTLLAEADKRGNELIDRLMEAAVDISVETEAARLEGHLLTGAEFTESCPLEP